MTDAATDASTLPAYLVLTRRSDRDSRIRQVFASLDGEHVGDMVFGEQIRKDIAAGEHRLRVHNTLFWKTLEFTAAPGETVEFSMVNYSGRGFWSFALILGVAPLFLTVERTR